MLESCVTVVHLHYLFLVCSRLINFYHEHTKRILCYTGEHEQSSLTSLFLIVEDLTRMILSHSYGGLNFIMTFTNSTAIIIIPFCCSVSVVDFALLLLFLFLF
jgi:hypothetical protein